MSTNVSFTKGPVHVQATFDWGHALEHHVKEKDLTLQGIGVHVQEKANWNGHKVSQVVTGVDPSVPSEIAGRILGLSTEHSGHHAEQARKKDMQDLTEKIGQVLGKKS